MFCRVMNTPTFSVYPHPPLWVEIKNWKAEVRNVWFPGDSSKKVSGVSLMELGQLPNLNSKLPNIIYIPNI